MADTDDIGDDIGARQWRRITATVRPIKHRAKPVNPAAAVPEPEAAWTPTPAGMSDLLAAPAPTKARVRRPRAPIGSTPVNKEWERALRGGTLVPDMVIDLHGHHLAGAHGAMMRALDRAVSTGARIMLVVAGKARGAEEAPRGAIRRELVAWLSHSPHSARILAVRGAHPRHGGSGALYIVLRA